jgi:hypothetical protein
MKRGATTPRRMEEQVVELDCEVTLPWRYRLAPKRRRLY